MIAERLSYMRNSGCKLCCARAFKSFSKVGNVYRWPMSRIDKLTYGASCGFRISSKQYTEQIIWRDDLNGERVKQFLGKILDIARGQCVCLSLCRSRKYMTIIRVRQIELAPFRFLNMYGGFGECLVHHYRSFSEGLLCGVRQCSGGGFLCFL